MLDTCWQRPVCLGCVLITPASSTRSLGFKMQGKTSRGSKGDRITRRSSSWPDEQLEDVVIEGGLKSPLMKRPSSEKEETVKDLIKNITPDFVHLSGLFLELEFLLNFCLKEWKRAKYAQADWTLPLSGPTSWASPNKSKRWRKWAHRRVWTDRRAPRDTRATATIELKWWLCWWRSMRWKKGQNASNLWISNIIAVVQFAELNWRDIEIMYLIDDNNYLRVRVCPFVLHY